MLKRMNKVGTQGISITLTLCYFYAKLKPYRPIISCKLQHHAHLPTVYNGTLLGTKKNILDGP